MSRTTTEMNLVDINKLIPYVNNARTHSPEQINKLRASLREFGFVNPVIIDKEFNIIAGHGRVLAAKAEGIKEVINHTLEETQVTYGTMMKDIKSFFKKKGLFFGFTGTPLFDENNAKGKINEENEEIKTTKALFGPPLHEYRIDEAIRDRNVLGFYIDYINTGEFKSYDDLKDQLIEQLKSEYPDRAERDIERKVQEMENDSLEKECKGRKIK